MITIADYDPAWPARFAAERDRILGVVPTAVIEHVGSTAVPGLGAKPIIDMMLGMESFDAIPVEPFLQLGYDHVTKYDHLIPEPRKYFVQPDVFHLHCVELHGLFWVRHLQFRDYLRDHPDRARAYHELKLRLAEEHANDRLGYNFAKTAFIEEAVARSR